MDTNQLQLENEKLNARLEKAKEVFRQQAADIKVKDKAYLKLRDEYNEVVRERDIHLEANAKFNKQILEAEALIKELQTSDSSNTETLQEELNIVKKELHIANERITDYDTKCTRYDEVIKSLNEKNDELSEGVKYWEERYHKLSETHLVESTELNNLKVKNDELTTEYNLLNEQFVDLENEYSNSEELRTSYTEATNKLNEEVSRLQDIIVSKDAAYKNLESTYNDAAAEHIRDVNALKYTIEQLKKDLEDKDTKLVDACAKVGRLTKQLEDESGKVEEVKTKTEEAVTSIKKKLQALNDGLGDEFNIFG